MALGAEDPDTECNADDSNEWDKVILKDDRLYLHKLMRIRYTTYDVRRAEDMINPRTAHRDIMVLADNTDSSDHPFMYARVIKIFHLNAIYSGRVMGSINYRPQKLHCLWVRWFQLDPKAAQGGWRTCNLDRINFPKVNDNDAFGFLDPADVLRGCHIIPSFFGHKKYVDSKGHSGLAKDGEDWRTYYVNRSGLVD